MKISKDKQILKTSSNTLIGMIIITISTGFITGCTPLNETHNYITNDPLPALNDNPAATFSDSVSITSLNRSDWPAVEARVASLEIETRPVYWKSYHFGGDNSVRDIATYPTLETAYKIDHDKAGQIAPQYLEIVTDPFLQIFNFAALPFNMIFRDHPTNLHLGPRGQFEQTPQDLRPVQLYTPSEDNEHQAEKDSE